MIKTLAKNIKGYTLVSILTPLFIILEVILEAFIVYITKDLINLMNPENGEAIKDLAPIIPIAIQLVVMAFLSLCCGVANGITGARASAGFAANLRKNVFHNIQDFSFENIDNFQTSSLITRLTTDVTSCQDAFITLIRMLFRAPVMFVVSLIMCTTIKIELTSILFII